MDKAMQIAYNEHFELNCKLAAEAGFQGISVNFHDMTDRSKKAWEEAPERICSILEQTHLKCVQTHLPYYPLRTSAEILEEDMEDAMYHSIEVSGRIGAPWCVYHPRSAVNAGFVRKKSLEINQEVIGRYLECALKYGTGMALENLPIFHGVIPVMPFYTSDYSDLCELTDGFGSAKVGICWDTGHANLMHLDQADAVKYLGKRIVCTHVHNNFGDADWHLTPETGNIAWDKVMKAFGEIGYQGPLTLEVHCYYHEEQLLSSFMKHNYHCLEFLEKIVEAGN